MLEDYLVSYAAPTLADLKTGNLFAIPYTSRQQLQREVEEVSERLSGKKLCLMIIHFYEKRALVYLYRPDRLQQDLRDSLATKILRAANYKTLDAAECIHHLIQRMDLSAGEEFPHEIGLFLSYPPADVKGFIENKGENCKCCGCWKGYGDRKSAEDCFRRYKKCTEAYCRSFACGVRLEELAVAGG